MKKKIVKKDGEGWVYTSIIKEHFFHPRNVLIDESKYKADGVGMVGNPYCGDMMNIWIKVDKKKGRIKECKWRTFGCASAIASTSMMSVMVTENGGKTIEDAMKITPKQIADRLGGMPDKKFHCSVLGHEALREAVLDYLKNIKTR